jgi:hypothetical protein
MIECGLAPDGALIIRCDKHNMDRLIRALRNAIIYGETVATEEDEMTIRIYKEYSPDRRHQQASS